MSEMRELLDTELDAVCGGHHGHHGRAELSHKNVVHLISWFLLKSSISVQADGSRWVQTTVNT